MTFADPRYLWLLLAVPPAMAAFFWWSGRVRQRLMTQFIHARLLPGLVAGDSPARQRIREACLILAVAALILALAQPQWGYDLEQVQQRGLDIVVAIDTSKSMLAEDIAPSRLARAKLAALDLMQQAKSDRMGLVAFAGDAFLQCPLTVDDTAFRQSVQALDVNTIPEGGTAVAEAIGTALDAFKEGGNYKVLVLFTDGEDHDSGALEAAKNAAKSGLRIFTVGIGSAQGALLRIKNADGQMDYIRDENGNVVQSRLNETLLQEIAGAANGFYLPLRGADTIDTLYKNGLAPLPRSELKERWIKRPHERYHWPLAVAMALLIAEMLFPERKRELKPAVLAALSAKSALAVTLLLLLPPPPGAFGSPAGALRDYKAGRFNEAQKEYERLSVEDKTGDARFSFNAGAAAYRATNYDAAIKLFTAALSARDVRLQQAAYFNMGNAQFLLGQSTNDLDELQKQWETAIQNYQNAVALNKNDADAAHNLALAKHGVEEIMQLREAARQAKEAADESTRRRNYHRALEIMRDLMRQNPLGKQFEDYTRKLQDIDAIANPHLP
jgi:Ca-activated chloride channel family protein